MKHLIKYMILTAGITLSAQAVAYGGHGHRHHGHRHHGHGHGHGAHWVVPFIIGAGATYILTRPQVVVEPAPVIGPSPYCPPGTGYFGHDWRTFTDQWGRYYTQQVPICR
jgi:hypothetical protein